MDAESETLVQDALSVLLKDKTVMVIAHRMRTVANADKIVVLDDGKVSEMGTPAELMAKGGLYSHLVALQQGRYLSAWRRKDNMFSLLVRMAWEEHMEKKRHTTASGEDYLEAILVLQKKMGMVRSVDVARHLDVSKPSVCHAVATLREGGFLTMDEDNFLHLTDAGCEVAEQVYEKHRFFTQRLIAAGVDPKTAEADACRIEHVISEESFQRLKAAVEPKS